MKTKRLFAVMTVALGLLANRAEADPRRFALFVGSNVGDNHEAVLRHAEDDASRVSKTLRTLGDFSPTQIVVLNGANASELRDAIVHMNVRVREQRDAVLVFFYSGHADAESLHLAGTHFPLSELKGLLVGSPANSRVLVVDACQSGSLIGVKGARAVPTFEVTALEDPAPEGFAVLTSATASESAQESAALHGSFFSYFLNSGLLGAADQNRDGEVTLSELYAFSSAETRAATVTSPAGPQTPTFQFMLGGRRDLVLTRPGRKDTRMGTLAFAEAGRYVVQQWDDGLLTPPIADVASHEPGARLTLPPGRYHVTRRGQRDIAEADISVVTGQVATVGGSDLSRVAPARVVRKGGERRSATGPVALLGWRSDEQDNASHLSLGSGLVVWLGVRHDRRWLSFEARLGFESESADSTLVRISNRGLSLSLAALYPIDLRWFTLSLGAAAGWVLLHQQIRDQREPTSLDLMPAIHSSKTSRWVNGPELGPLAQLDLPVGGRLFLRVETGLLYRFFNPAPSSSDQSVQRGAHWHIVGGGGLSF
jgi:hypothetical protein